MDTQQSALVLVACSATAGTVGFLMGWIIRRRRCFRLARVVAATHTAELDAAKCRAEVLRMRMDAVQTEVARARAEATAQIPASGAPAPDSSV